MSVPDVFRFLLQRFYRKIPSIYDIPKSRSQVKRPSRNEFDGVADSKTLVTWEVERPSSSSQLQVAQLQSPKRLKLQMTSKFFSERRNVQLPRSGTMLSMQSFPEAFETLEGEPSAKHEVTVSESPEMCEHREFIEFFSETHQKWTVGSIEGCGIYVGNQLCYDVRLSRQQMRRVISLDRIRQPFREGDVVSVQVADLWQEARVERRHGYPLAYEVQLPTSEKVVAWLRLTTRAQTGHCWDDHGSKSVKEASKAI